MRWKPEDLEAFEKRTEVWRKAGTTTTHVLKDGNRPKYKNRKTLVDGLQFDSQKEAHRWGVLKLMAIAGEIIELERQVRFELKVNGQKICGYVADFTYRDPKKPGLIVEDSKGFRTRDYIIKKKLMRALHGIEVLET